VTVFERDDRIGGLLRYGIPEFKMEKRYLDRRLQLMEKDGSLPANSHVGVNVPVAELRREFDAVSWPAAPAGRAISRCGARAARHPLRMEYLKLQNQRCEGDAIADERFITAQGQAGRDHRRRRHRRRLPGHVHRQGAVSVSVRAVAAAAGRARADNPWAPMAEHLPCVRSARGGRRPRVFGLDAAVHGRREGA